VVERERAEVVRSRIHLVTCLPMSNRPTGV
jgi:hypothetical protein